MKSKVLAAVLAASIASAPLTAGAWETSTHTGLAEQAALAGQLDAHLRALGVSGGLFEPLTIPPADAKELTEALARHSPSGGYVPDARGRQYALAWLLAGAALADSTATWAANHFFDPRTGAGWKAPRDGMVRSLTDRAQGATQPPPAGMPALEWVTSPQNPLNYQGFLDQYEKALRAPSPGERSRHLAGALIAAGAILHVLGDMASPSRVRGDAAAHEDTVGVDPADRGSRFERLAAIAWGRLGVPAAPRTVSAPTLRAFFVGDGGQVEGLAVWTSTQFFSPGTLPRAIDIGNTRRDDLSGVLTRSLTRPAPTVPRRLSLMKAGQPGGATLKGTGGVCLARYGVAHGQLSWWLDDECLVAQAQAILPVAAAYEAGLLRWLFRGDLRLAQPDGGPVTVTVHGTPLGKGTLTLLAEDGRGVRTPFATVEVAAGADGAVVATSPVPADAHKVIASFRGVDAAGEAVVAAGVLDLGA